LNEEGIPTGNSKRISLSQKVSFSVFADSLSKIEFLASVDLVRACKRRTLTFSVNSTILKGCDRRDRPDRRSARIDADHVHGRRVDWRMQIFWRR
jgi:hypothetical protein